MRNSSENQMKLTLIRHGKTAGNLQNRYIGLHTDETLCTEGIAELQSFCKLGVYDSIAKTEGLQIFSSPMKRCVETAEIIVRSFFNRADNPENINSNISIIENFAEIDFGDFEGKTYNELNGNDDYQKWIDSGGTIAFSHGECRDAFISRTIKGFSKLLLLCKSKNAVAFVHGGTIMALISSLFGGNYFDFQVKNGLGYQCLVSNSNEAAKIVEIKEITETLENAE